MHRAFISERDYESYETPERARQRRENDRAEDMATHAYDTRIPANADRNAAIPPKADVPVMVVSELSEGPNLPHRDDKDISTLARDTAWKAGYYQAGIDAFSTDAYMEKPSPIDRKAGSKRQRRHFTSNGEEYYVTHGAGTDRPLTSSNKHLAYWRRPTERDALANVMREGKGTATAEPQRYIMSIPRSFLVTLARVHDIQAQRGKLQGDGRGDMLRELATLIAPGESVDVEWFTPSDVLGMTQNLPKRYRTGEFGQFLKDTATFAKLNK